MLRRWCNGFRGGVFRGHMKCEHQRLSAHRRCWERVPLPSSSVGEGAPRANPLPAPVASSPSAAGQLAVRATGQTRGRPLRLAEALRPAGIRRVPCPAPMAEDQTLASKR